MQPEISIILPSFNGSDTLPECLDALCSIDLAGSSVEVLLIDNASEDATPEIMAGYARRNGWRHLSEPRRGKSFALNTGVDAAKGGLLAFLDDDVMPDPGWLAAFRDASRAAPSVAVFAGQVRPRWMGRAPDWLQRMADEGRCCGCTALARDAGPYPAIHVKGGNLLIRRSALADTRFDTVSGNFDGSPSAVGGEDTRLVKCLVDAGNEVHFVPKALAHHMIQPHEATLAALFRRQMRIGRSDAAKVEGSIPARMMVFPAIGAYAAAVLVLLLIGQRTHAIRQLMKIATRVGRVQGWFLRT